MNEYEIYTAFTNMASIGGNDIMVWKHHTIEAESEKEARETIEMMYKNEDTFNSNVINSVEKASKLDMQSWIMDTLDVVSCKPIKETEYSVVYSIVIPDCRSKLVLHRLVKANSEKDAEQKVLNLSHGEIMIDISKFMNEVLESFHASKSSDIDITIDSVNPF